MNLQFTKIKLTDIQINDVVFFYSPLPHTKTVVKVGWYYSKSIDNEYYKIDFNDGTDYVSQSPNDVLLVGHSY
jgi:hypothetical protein